MRVGEAGGDERHRQAADEPRYLKGGLVQPAGLAEEKRVVPQTHLRGGSLTARANMPVRSRPHLGRAFGASARNGLVTGWRHAGITHAKCRW